MTYIKPNRVCLKELRQIPQRALLLSHLLSPLRLLRAASALK